MVTTVAGTGTKGNDLFGGESKASDQLLSSPWDITNAVEDNQFIICMAGSHQIWKLDL